jgi:hypothetical protein
MISMYVCACVCVCVFTPTHTPSTRWRDFFLLSPDFKECMAKYGDGVQLYKSV